MSAERRSLLCESCREHPYATHNGFYLGDEVVLPDGRHGCIDEILCKEVHTDGEAVYSVVRLDDELWIDGWLTRV